MLGKSRGTECGTGCCKGNVTENILIRILWMHTSVIMPKKDTTKHTISIKPVSFLVTIFIHCWTSPVSDVWPEQFFRDSAVILAGKLRTVLSVGAKFPSRCLF